MHSGRRAIWLTSVLATCLMAMSGCQGLRGQPEVQALETPSVEEPDATPGASASTKTAAAKSDTPDDVNPGGVFRHLRPIDPSSLPFGVDSKARDIERNLGVR